MLAATLALLGLALAPTAPDDPAPDARAAYLDARSKAGRDADAQVRLALWCEQHGLPAERLKHLALAVLADPAHAAARGLMGQVEDSDGRWRKPEEIVRRTQADPASLEALAEYDRRRAASDDSADDQWALGVWCEQNGLPLQARAHFTSVARLDPSRDAAWKRLGCKKVDGRWMTAAQVAAYKLDRDEQEAADRRWRPRLEKWRDQLRDERRRADAEAGLAGVRDPRAVPSIVRTFGTASESDQRHVVQLLGQIDSREASRALAALALIGKSDAVRRQAVESLRARDPREYADLLIARLRDPIEYEVRNVNGPGNPGVLYVKGKQANLRRVYTSPGAPGPAPGDRLVGYDDAGLPMVVRDLGTFETGWFQWSQYAPAVAALPMVQAARSGLGVPTAEQYRQEVAAAQARLAQFGAQAGTPEARQALQGISTALGHTSTPDPRLLMTYPLAALAQGDPILSTIAAEGLYGSIPLNPGTYLDIRYRAQATIPLGAMQAEAQRAAMSAQAQLDADVASIEAQNTEIGRVNDRAVSALRDATGQDFPAEREAWEAWYVDQLGYRSVGQSSTATPTVTEVVPFDARPVPVLVTGQRLEHQRVSCFGAGTLVHTLHGLRPIESLRVGDPVLSMDPKTGRLDYQPVLAVHHNPPGATVNVGVGDETIVASLFHRFWEAGRGWTMARDLQPGDPVRTLAGPEPLAGVSQGADQPVYNLDVAGGRTFFVGRAGVLVHDNSLPDLRATPFDRPAELADAR
jgi:hypothetical protein